MNSVEDNGKNVSLCLRDGGLSSALRSAVGLTSITFEVAIVAASVIVVAAKAKFYDFYRIAYSSQRQTKRQWTRDTSRHSSSKKKSESTDLLRR